MDIDALWHAATDTERRELVEELVQAVHAFPDYLEVEITGAPRLNVLLSEVGLPAELQMLVSERGFEPLRPAKDTRPST
jgi:hypothetical protein